MSNQEFQTINLNGEQVLARQVKLDDGTLQWRNKFGLALSQVEPINGKGDQKAAKEDRKGNGGVQGGEAKKRQAGTGKGTQGKKPQAGGNNRAA
jgi:hypothetical protein